MNKINIKIMFLDIDGTLTNTNKEITKNTINTLNKLINNNIYIILCTGRDNNYTIKYLNKINKSKYTISNNGALIYDNILNKVIVSHTLYENNLNYLWEYANKTKSSMIINTINNRYGNKYIKNNNILVINNINEIDNKLQLVISNKDINIMKELEEYINTNTNLKVINKSLDYINNIKNGYYFFDIVNKNVSKGNAINSLLKILKINKKYTICFGDSINDIDMFKSVNYCVAMGNSIKEIKSIATYITDTNDNDGISKFCNDYILKNTK